MPWKLIHGRAGAGGDIAAPFIRLIIPHPLLFPIDECCHSSPIKNRPNLGLSLVNATTMRQNARYSNFDLHSKIMYRSTVIFYITMWVCSVVCMNVRTYKWGKKKIQQVFQNYEAVVKMLD